MFQWRKWFSGVSPQPKQDKHLLDRTHALWALVVESSHDAIYTREINGTITTWNEGARNVYGYSEQEILGKSFYTLIPPEKREETVILAEQIHRGAKIDHFETVRLHKSGSRVHVSLTLSPLYLEGAMIGVSTIARDISTRKQIEETASKAQMRFQEIFHFSTDAMAYAALDGKLVNVNPAYVELTGYTREELLGGMTYLDLTPKEHWVPEAKILSSVFERGEAVEYEKEYMRRNGNRVPIRLTVFPVKDTSGVITAIAAIIRDLSRDTTFDFLSATPKNREAGHSPFERS